MHELNVATYLFRCMRGMSDVHIFLYNLSVSEACEQKLSNSIYCLANL